MDVPQLISDLAIMLSTAGVVTVVFKKLRLPLILGYIVAGFLISPYFPLFLDVRSLDSINTLSEIGVIIILFHIGLEFDIKKIASIGSTAVVSALVKMGGVMICGYGLGMLLGLKSMDCLFLGAMLSISSTVVIQKCFEEQGLQEEKFTSLVMGSLVMEDIFGVFIMVVLTTIAVSQNISGVSLTMHLGKMASYLIIWLLLGIYIVPTVLNKIKDRMSDEMISVSSIGFCFLMGIVATKLGFSMELGAFLAGSLLAGTKYATNIEQSTVGIKDLFGAIFFLSVGMQVDPAVIGEQWMTIIPIAIFAVIAKLIFAMIGMLLSGQDLETSIKAGVSLAPIGEFSFIIATLGISLDVIDEYLYPVIVSASILTIIVAPSLIKSSDRIVALFNRVLPNKLLKAIDEFTSDDQTDEEKAQDWHIVVRSFLSKLVVFGSIMLVAAEAGVRILQPALRVTFGDSASKIICLVLIYLVMILFTRPLLDFHSVSFTHLWLDRRANRPPLMVMTIVKLMAIMAIAYIPLKHFYEFNPVLLLVFIVIVIVILARSSLVQTYYLQLETRFLRNLHENTIDDDEAEYGPHHWLDEDFSIFSFIVPDDARYEGKTIHELDWGRKYSVFIVKLRHGNKNIVMPQSSTIIHSGDKVYLLGETDNLTSFHRTLGLGELDNLRTLKEFMDNDYPDTDNALACIAIKIRGTEKYSGKTIKQCKIRSKAHCMILGIQRDGYAHKMPGANMRLLPGDILWIMGSNNNVGILASYSVGKTGKHDSAQQK